MLYIFCHSFLKSWMEYWYYERGRQLRIKKYLKQHLTSECLTFPACGWLVQNSPMSASSLFLIQSNWNIQNIRTSVFIFEFILYIFLFGGRFTYTWGFPVAQVVKRLSAMWDTRVWSLGWEDPLEKEMATHSSILAWKIPWIEEPGGLQSIGLQRVGHDWGTSLS